MKYEKKYPNARYTDIVDGVYKNNKVDKCDICGQETNWLSTNFPVLICSEECNSKKWIDYEKSLKIK